jgi:lipopolysaccharide export system permease protein
MIKTYEQYLVKLFLKKILIVSLIFLSLIFILSIFDEISFFKDLEVNFFFPFLITILNVPSTLFEIFPFIFLIGSQFFFLELIQKNELEVLKINGLNNLKVIKIIFFTSFILGVLLVSLYYNFSSKLKFVYLDLKNNYSNDNKYLAVVTENGLWIKDEIDNKIYIVNAGEIENEFLKEVSISVFSRDFDLIQILESKSIDISNLNWIIYNPTISKTNKTIKQEENITLRTHFDKKKINSLFSNLSSLNMLELSKLSNDYAELGYSTSEVKSHLNRLFSFPLYLSIMSIFASVIMFNIKRSKPMIFHIILGIFLSVLIYYFYYLFNLLGLSGKIPLTYSIWLPLLILTILIFIGLIRINEK